MTDPLSRLADRASADHLFLGYVLARYALLAGITPDELRAWLGCPVERWSGLRLCLVPRHAADVATIAERVGCDAGRLAEVCGAG